MGLFVVATMEMLRRTYADITTYLTRPPGVCYLAFLVADMLLRPDFPGPKPAGETSSPRNDQLRLSGKDLSKRPRLVRRCAARKP